MIGVYQLTRVTYQSTNSVPNPNNFNPNIIRQAQLVLVLLIPLRLYEGLPVRILTVGLPHLCKLRHVHCTEDTDITYQAGD